MSPTWAEYASVRADVIAVLEEARHASARSVNALMTASYWLIGRRIVEFEQGGRERATYGDALMDRLAQDLRSRFGRGFSRRSIEQMRAFYTMWPIPQTPSAEFGTAPFGHSMVATPWHLNTIAQAFPLPWSAYVRLLSVKNPLARSFYETESLRCGWSVRQLDRQIQSQFYERVVSSTIGTLPARSRRAPGAVSRLRAIATLVGDQ